MYISIHELLAVARESEGKQAAKGDAMLCEKRFEKATCHMVEFILLKGNKRFGEKGEYHRYFLTTEEYKELVEMDREKHIRIQRHAFVIEGNLYYIPPPAVSRGGGR
ncbi:MAG: DUF5720 family protein [Clostridia bacterium]